jgi:hypothetical protein
MIPGSKMRHLDRAQSHVSNALEYPMFRGIEVDDAIEIAEKIKIGRPMRYPNQLP